MPVFHRHKGIMHVCMYSNFPIVWFAAPEIVELEVLSTRELTKGEMANISYPFNPEIGVTLQYRVEQGTFNVLDHLMYETPHNPQQIFPFPEINEPIFMSSMNCIIIMYNGYVLTFVLAIMSTFVTLTS